MSKLLPDEIFETKTKSEQEEVMDDPMTGPEIMASAERKAMTSMPPIPPDMSRWFGDTPSVKTKPPQSLRTKRNRIKNKMQRKSRRANR